MASPWIARSVLRLALASGAGAVLWGVCVEPRRLEVHSQALVLDDWPRALSGLRIAAIADVHGGAPWIDAAALDRLVDTTNRQRPDLVVLLGDFVIHHVLGGRFMPPEIVAGHLGRLRAPLGVVAVLGNHDHGLDAPRVRRALEDRSIRVLQNQSLEREWGGRRLWLVGVDDVWLNRADIPAALRGVPSDAPTILLVHNPDVFPNVPPRVALTLAGHTHGGQVSLPILGPPVVPSLYGQRYAAGHVVEGGRHLFVTTGVGTSILPLRLGVAPEIALLSLESEPPSLGAGPDRR